MKMKKKSSRVVDFVEGLHQFIIKNPTFRWDTSKKSETEIQTEIRPLIIQYLMLYFQKEGVKDFIAKAHSSFYWEGQEGKFGCKRQPVFGARAYPDFIITAPYLIAIEYKQSPTGSTVKHGIGQSMIHTMSGEFDFSYYLYHDESADKRTEKSITDDVPTEQEIIDKMW